MATPNYSYEKRQRELAKKRKNEEKLQKKKHPGPAGSSSDEGNGPDNPPAEAVPGNPGSATPNA